MITGTVPFLFNCCPYDNESLVGFLLRLTEAHGLQSPSQLLQQIRGKSSQPPRASDIPRLADLCGCDPNAIASLFGFEFRDENRNAIWRIADQSLTKRYFISSRILSICPACLTDHKYLHAEWELTLNTACPIHGILLVSQCAHCGRYQRWMRPGVSVCNCGGSLLDAPVVPASDFQLLIAHLVRARIDPNFKKLGPLALPPAMTARLACLSLDGLFKTLWFIGRILHMHRLIENHRAAPKKILNAGKILDLAYNALSDWPYSLFDRLKELDSKSQTSNSTRLLRSIYGPIHRYLMEDMTSPEFRFVLLAYELHVKRTWAIANKIHPKSLSPQLDLDLEDY